MFLSKKINNIKDISNNKELPNNNQIIDEEYDGNNRDRDIVTYKDIDPNVISEEKFIPIKENNAKVYFVIQCCYCKSKNPDNSILDKLKYLLCFFWCPCYAKVEKTSEFIKN